MAGEIFRYTHRVTYSECTVGDHIYYARYLDLLEAARGELFRQLGFPLSELQRQNVIFPVIECQLRYKSPARYDDVLMIETEITLAKGVRLNFKSRILNPQGRLILEAETQHVCTSIDEKPTRLPEKLMLALQP